MRRKKPLATNSQKQCLCAHMAMLNATWKSDGSLLYRHPNCSIFQHHFLRFSDFKNTLNPVLGNCFTYNFNLSSHRFAYRAGAEFGLTVLLQGSQDDYICTSQTAGFRVLIHNATEYPFPDAAGYYIEPGTSNDIAISQVSCHPHWICFNSEVLSPGVFIKTSTTCRRL